MIYTCIFGFNSILKKTRYRESILRFAADRATGKGREMACCHGADHPHVFPKFCPNQARFVSGNNNNKGMISASAYPQVLIRDIRKFSSSNGTEQVRGLIGEFLRSQSGFSPLNEHLLVSVAGIRREWS